MAGTFSKNKTGFSHVAFFDLDRTIIRSNSGQVLVRHAYRKGYTGLSGIIKGIWYAFLYRSGLRNPVSIISSMTAWIKGMSEDELQRIASEIFNEYLLEDIRPGIKERIAHHKDQGGMTVILSSALVPVCREVADHLEMDDVISTSLETKDGIYTGLPTGTFCFGKEKPERIRQYCEMNNFDISGSWYYADSIGDFHALSIIGHPVCVNPDRRLKREALKKGWEIL